MKDEELKRLIVRSLKQQGFVVRDGRVQTPPSPDKETIRNLHSQAVTHRIETSREKLAKKEIDLLSRLATGLEIIPERISPRLIEVASETEDSLLFRYATLHWSIPISTGYGRRLRFLVIDQQNDKLIGIIGLGDPVFGLGARDRWIGWDKQMRSERLNHVMDAFVLGAVPPYSYLLCGKLIAMLVSSTEVREAFKSKYGGQQSLISRKKLDARLALITTTSALGRSSIYNRLKYRDRLLYHSVGFTQGFGEFHFTNGLYNAISEYASDYTEPTAKNELWGVGFRNRREVVRKCLTHLGIKSDWTHHGVQREIFVVPLAHNTKSFLCGEHSRLRSYNQSVEELSEFFRARWLLPRSQRDQTYRNWSQEAWRLWRE
jgi:Domain of unknown function (DUF4338)